MFKQIICHLYDRRLQYAIYFLLSSVFLGNALLSISYAIFIIVSLSVIKTNFSFVDLIQKRMLFHHTLYLLINLFVILILGELNEIIKIKKLFPFFILPFLFQIIYDNHRESLNLRNIKKVYIFSAAVTLTVSLLIGVFKMFFASKTINSIYITYNFLADTFGVQAIYLSVFYLLAIIFSIDLIKKKELHTRLYFFLSILLFLGIVLLSSRTTLVITIIVVFIKVKSMVKLKRVLILFFTGLIAIGVLITFSIPTLKDRVFKINQNVSSYSGLSLRTKIWINAYEIYKDSPVIGYGIYRSQKKLMQQYKTVNFRRALLNNLNAHNQYIQSLIDTGILGFGVLLFLIFGPLKTFSENSLNYNLFIFIIGLSLLTESFFLRQYGIIFFCVFGPILYLFSSSEANHLNIHEPYN